MPRATSSHPNLKRSAHFSKRADDSLQRARTLRKSMSPPERKLWVRLRNCQLAGLRFRRQHPIGEYAADFYCQDARLVVELDGGLHDPLHDKARDSFMRAQGLDILRIPVSDFERNIPGALELIRRIALARITEAEKKS